MMRDDDQVFEALASLPSIGPDSEWERRVRARCHSAIGRRVPRRARRRLFGPKFLDLAAAAALCVYLAAVLIEAVRLRGSL
ncbi:MAG TPA: hypothetical protein VG297_04755 [Bryobacteraceae bacterium]|jgi:hypothetical protein|nr:hypothetical protein [Bryobacteraceae bacterium]